MDKMTENHINELYEMIDGLNEEIDSQNDRIARLEAMVAELLARA